MAKKYIQSRVLDKTKVYSNVGSKIAKPKNKGYKAYTHTLKAGESLKCSCCRCMARRSQGHRKVYIITRKSITSVYSVLCYECKIKLLKG